MTYHVTILRTRQSHHVPIEMDEAEGVVEFFSSLVVKRTDRGRLEISNEHEGKVGSVLIWQEGEIWTENPDKETLQLMLEMAKHLDARVRGDELETYRTPDETYLHPDDAASAQKTDESRRRLLMARRLKEWGIFGIIMLVFVLLGLVVNRLT